MKKILYAHLEQVISFETKEEKAKYFEHLNRKKERYRVLKEWSDSEHLYIKIRKAYNNCKMEGEENEVQ